MLLELFGLLLPLLGLYIGAALFIFYILPILVLLALIRVLYETLFPAPKPPTPFRFTHLPLELRLDIYSRCTAFSLLQLSHANHSIRVEILRDPRVYNSSDGYRDPNGLPYQGKAYLWKRWRIGKRQLLPGLTIHQIDRITNATERKLAERLLMRRSHRALSPGPRFPPVITCWFLCGTLGRSGCGRILWISGPEFSYDFPGIDCDCGLRNALMPIMEDGLTGKRLEFWGHGGSGRKR
ncbi:hypothetical protein BJ508DRAFT_362192 [Ascobolus immersus RN42]|uniref:F-box domain-containing protein n=1 Tax=Ascobolus immersus RN42 TaxID=1160509 RepID=A0A3N4I9U6_ASCIM|nr:hypothetical protein BJ508DRAFT_362192 [Ascobolus immersus RN42]